MEYINNLSKQDSSVGSALAWYAGGWQFESQQGTIFSLNQKGIKIKVTFISVQMGLYSVPLTADCGHI